MSSPSSPDLLIHAGSRARAHLREHGLRAQDIAIIPAAAGGPKGLIFRQLDQWIFGHWLPQAPRPRMLIGSSIGAWRMAAACHADPVAAFDRLANLYCERQRYSAHPTPAEITGVCRDILKDFIGGHEAEILGHPHHRLHIIAARGLGRLESAKPSWPLSAAFAAAVWANLRGRDRLGRHFERLVLHDMREHEEGSPHWNRHWSESFDRFPTTVAELKLGNLQEALLASGTLPFIMEAVQDLPLAPSGRYWDGGLVDYHLALPYSQATSDLVLYPHFSPRIVPGWLDKKLPWRRRADPQWLENLVVVSPSPAFLKRLPRGALPSRKDFTHYGLDHDRRIHDWRVAMTQGAALRDALMEMVDKPDPAGVLPL